MNISILYDEKNWIKSSNTQQDKSLDKICLIDLIFKCVHSYEYSL
jgi:hypothetical protein